MKLMCKILLGCIILLWNFPIFLILCIISLWEWNTKPIEDYFYGLMEGVEKSLNME